MLSKLAFAVPGPSSGLVNILNPDQFKFNGVNIGSIIGSALQYIFAFAGFALLLMLISAGFTFLTSAGDAKKMTAGKQRLTNAVLGFLIIFAAYWLVLIAGRIFGISEVGNIFQTTPGNFGPAERY